jgi:cytochrome c551/c552
MLTRVTLFVAATLIAAFAFAPQAMANPAIAQKEGKACTACHTAPPALNDAGQKYKAGMKK